MRRDFARGMLIATMLAGCASSAIPAWTWTAPDGSEHAAGREADARVAQLDPEDGGDGSWECTTDRDCDDRPGGVCVASYVPAGYQNVDCRYDACRVDRDCGADAICIPAGVVGPTSTCAKASCRSNEDCAGEARCRMMAAGVASPIQRFGCVGPDDPCDRGRPCPPLDGRDRICVMGDDGVRCELDPGPPP